MNFQSFPLLLLAGGLSLALVGCGPRTPQVDPPPMVHRTPEAPAVEAPSDELPQIGMVLPDREAPAGGEGAGAAAKSGSGNPQVVLTTSMGEIEIELYPEKAPLTVENFLGYVKKNHYDGTIFHRIIPTFMIQGGGFTPDGREKDTGPGVRNEAERAFKEGLKNERGTVAMARTPDPHSASAQFFINTVDNDFLNYPGRDGFGYTVFGRVTNGMEVVDKIKAVPTTNRPTDDWPVDPPVIKSARVK
jgi:peptidyl-prolyl cis-trans isomerase A (cyclophilin A)